MINFDDLIKENIKENNLNWVQIHDHLYRISISEAQDMEKQNLYLI